MMLRFNNMVALELELAELKLSWQIEMKPSVKERAHAYKMLKRFAGATPPPPKPSILEVAGGVSQ
ncbi:hypothetical protein J6590_057680 [Homalodisca vitripennis]|nr:hypothetical protein J6590_057680 [Homalodisca vitripennis]